MQNDSPAKLALECNRNATGEHLGSWIRWTPEWRQTDGRGAIILVPRYGGPMNSYLTAIGDSFILAADRYSSVI